MSLKNGFYILFVCLCVTLALIERNFLEEMPNVGLLLQRTQGIYYSLMETPTPSSPWQKYLCDKRKINATAYPANAIPIRMQDGANLIKPSSDNIFLVESACNPLPAYRAWCAVESWAAQNPKGPVWYVMTSPYYEDPTGMVRKILDTYLNLQIISLDLSKLFAGTPLRDFFSSLRWTENTAWPEIQLSDLSRVALVWTYGGYYGDTDTICINDTSGLHDVIGFQNNNELANGQFHAHPNHTFLYEIMKHMVENYQPGVWGSLGPTCFTAVAAKLCGGPVSLKNELQKCANMTLLPPEAFFPVYWANFKSLLESNKGNEIKLTFNKSISIHFYNKLMKDNAVQIGTQSIYDAAAKKYCPVTYKYMSSHSTFFK